MVALAGRAANGHAGGHVGSGLALAGDSVALGADGVAFAGATGLGCIRERSGRQ